MGQGSHIINLAKTFNKVAEISPKGTECGIGGFQLYSDKTGNRPINGRRLAAAKYTINEATQEMKIDTTQSGEIKGYVSVSSLGNV